MGTKIAFAVATPSLNLPSQCLRQSLGGDDEQRKKNVLYGQKCSLTGHNLSNVTIIDIPPSPLMLPTMVFVSCFSGNFSDC